MPFICIHDDWPSQKMRCTDERFKWTRRFVNSDLRFWQMIFVKRFRMVRNEICKWNGRQIRILTQRFVHKTAFAQPSDYVDGKTRNRRSCLESADPLNIVRL